MIRIPAIVTRPAPVRSAAGLHATIAAAVMTAMLAACSPPQPPDKERPPEPQASAAPASDGATGLRDAVQAPIDRAKAAEQAVQDAAEAQRAAIEAAAD